MDRRGAHVNAATNWAARRTNGVAPTALGATMAWFPSPAGWT